jgi:membrane-bound acyltransferase YfiQ involved in biofilm formation
MWGADDPRPGWRNSTMSFAIYLAGFIILLAGVVWGLSVAGVPTIWIAIAALIMLGFGIITGVSHTRSKDPPEA